MTEEELRRVRDRNRRLTEECRELSVQVNRLIRRASVLLKWAEEVRGESRQAPRLLS
jgi:hypothetical protein